MITKKELKHYSQLLTKKYRQTENKFLVEGKKSVFEGLLSSHKCEIIFVTNKFQTENHLLISEFKDFRVESIKQNEFDKISDTETPQGIAAVFVKPDLKLRTELLKNEPLIILLDNISDPGNLGTIIRNCDWFGVKNVLLSMNTVEYTNPKAVRSSMGSIFHLNIYENVEVSQVEDFRNAGFELLCADLSGENVFHYISEKKKILILSNESNGPSDEFNKLVDKKITIPRIGNAESLNVASASAVLLAQLKK